MKIVFLESSRSDLRWFKRYYVSVFRDGQENANRRYLATLSTLRKNPMIGHPSEAVYGARELHISRTPFSFLYRVTRNEIEVLRVFDNRSNWDQRIVDDDA